MLWPYLSELFTSGGNDRNFIEQGRGILSFLLTSGRDGKWLCDVVDGEQF